MKYYNLVVITSNIL